MQSTANSKYAHLRRIQYAVYEKEPAHCKEPNSVILAPYKTKEEAEKAGKRYGYHGDNYYVDILKYD